MPREKALHVERFACHDSRLSYICIRRRAFVLFLTIEQGYGGHELRPVWRCLRGDSLSWYSQRKTLCWRGFF